MTDSPFQPALRRRDDGSLKTFEGYREQHSDLLGPGQGELRCQPSANVSWRIGTPHSDSTRRMRLSLMSATDQRFLRLRGKEGQSC